jgi:5-deoxy-glucuronate isomerase
LQKNGGKNMESRLFKATKRETGYTPIVTPLNSELKYIEFGTLLLNNKRQQYNGETEDREAVFTIFGGSCSVKIDGSSNAISYNHLGNRSDVFSGKPTMLYLPRQTGFKVTGESATLEAGISFASSDDDFPPVLVKPDQVVEQTVGATNWSRKVFTAVGGNISAQKLLVGETINPPGNWSSSPPHKHDRKSGNEAELEEVYFYKVKPPQGFGLQRIYTAPDSEEPFDEVYVVQNNDVVVIPRGYHPVVAAAGYSLYYLWILAGEERKYGAWSDDPVHSWLKNLKQ